MKLYLTFLTIFISSFLNAQSQQNIILIGIDGMSPHGLMKANTPNIDKLIKEGASTMIARSVRPTSSSSNWASMLMGAGPEQHGITSNDWERDNYEIAPACIGAESIFPSIFSLIHQQKPDMTTQASFHWDGIGRLIETSVINHVFDGLDEKETIEQFNNIIRTFKPNFNFLSVDHVDAAGHRFGHSETGYFAAIEYTDSLIGSIIEATKEAGIYENTIFIVLSDHGFLGYGHGGDSPEELFIPFVLKGPGIKKDFNITDPVYIQDVAATIASIFKLKTPKAWNGKPISCAFENNPCDYINLGELSLPKPIFKPSPSLYNQPGGLFMGHTLLEFEQPPSGSFIYYTVDGSSPTIHSNRYENPVTLTKTAIVKAKTISAKNEESAESIGFFRVIPEKGVKNVSYSLYNLPSETHYLPDYDKMIASRKGFLYEISMDSVISFSSKNTGVRFEAILDVPTDGEYTFITNSDDGSRLYIDNTLVVNNDGSHGLKKVNGKILLKKGKYAIKVDYFNGQGSGWLEVWWAGPYLSKQFIFPSYFTSKKDN